MYPPDVGERNITALNIWNECGYDATQFPFWFKHYGVLDEHDVVERLKIFRKAEHDFEERTKPKK